MNNKTKNKRENGITLIALSITIVILVILATVSINAVVGRGIIDVATRGADNYSESGEKEKETLNKATEYIDTVNGGIKTDIVPVLGKIALDKDIDDTEGNWIKITTNVTGIQNREVSCTLKMWKKANDTIDEELLVKEKPTKEVTETNVKEGENVELRISGLEEYTDYVYRVDVLDERNNEIKGNVLGVKTYCSGKKYYCDNSKCQLCGGTGSHNGKGIQVLISGTARRACYRKMPILWKNRC